jgi:predicted nucleic acid-binding protein
MKKGIVALLFALLLAVLAVSLVSCGEYEYTVKYYYEMPDGTYAEQRIERVTTGESIVNFEPGAVENYSLNRSRSKLAADLEADPDAVIEVYYDAVRYTVTFESLTVQGQKLDFADAGIYFFIDKNPGIPTAPTQYESMADWTQEDLQNFVTQIVQNNPTLFEKLFGEQM